MSREMKDSGIEWIGDIPREWESTRLKHLGKFVNGYAFKPEQWGYTGKRIIRIQDLTGSNDNPNYFDGEIDIKYHINNGDILVSWAATLDAFIWNKGEGLLNQHIFKAVHNKELISYEFFYWLLKETMENMNNDNKHGIVMQHVTLDVFNNFKVPLPNIVEQQRIAAFLDTQCAHIDSVIEKTRAAIEEYKRLKQSVITQAVTKGIRPNRKMKDSGIEWIDSIPCDWQECRIKNAIFPQQKEIKENDEIITCFRDGVVTLRKNRREDGFTVSFTEHGYQGVDIGDLVIHGMDAFAGSIGCSDSRGKTTPVVHVCNTIGNNRYFMYYLRSMAYGNILMDLSNGIRIRSSDFRNFAKLGVFKAVVPPIDEQSEIVAYLDEKTAAIDSLIQKKEQLITELEAYKKSLIYEYVTGKKEVKADITVEYSTEFKKALLMCRILELTQCKGRIHLQKTFFAIDTLLNLFSTQYYRFEHGPYDLDIESYEKIIEENGWLNIYVGKSIRYNKTNTFSDYFREYEKVFGDRDDIIQRICKVFNVPRTTKAEKIATLLAVWNDFLINGIEPTDDMIIDDVITNWTPNKANVSRETWSGFISKIRENNIVPKGYGKHTKRMEELVNGKKL